MTLTKFRRSQIVDAKAVTKFPSQFKNKDKHGRPVTDEHGIVDDSTKTAMVRLKFHLGKIFIEHETGSLTTITHTVRTDDDGRTWNKVTWKNQQGFKREFTHPDVLGEFLVLRYGIKLTTLILQAMSQLEQDALGE